MILEKLLELSVLCHLWKNSLPLELLYHARLSHSLVKKDQEKTTTLKNAPALNK